MTTTTLRLRRCRGKYHMSPRRALAVDSLRWIFIYGTADRHRDRDPDAVHLDALLIAEAVRRRDHLPAGVHPREFEWQNYAKVVQTIPFFMYMRNSAARDGVRRDRRDALGVAGGLRFRPAAVSRAEHRFSSSCLATMMIPYPVTMVPTFILFNKLGWVNTFLPLIVPPYLRAGRISVFLLRQFFMTINHELDEAAEVDGAGWFRIYWQIILPLSKPALATVAIFCVHVLLERLHGAVDLSERELEVHAGAGRQLPAQHARRWRHVDADGRQRDVRRCRASCCSSSPSATSCRASSPLGSRDKARLKGARICQGTGRMAHAAEP